MTSFRPIRHLSRAAFNMIEVVLAMAVIAIGVLAVVGLIPVGTKASRDAVGYSYAADYAEWLLAYIADQARYNWTTLNVFPNTGAGGVPPDIRNAADAPPVDIGSWTEIDSDKFPNFYYWQNTATQTIYRIHVAKVTPVGTRTDFDAIVRVWRSPVKEVTTSINAATPDNDCSEGAQINLEVTWPASLPPEDRTRAVFVMQVANES